jgi:hypothetical protein
MTSVPAALAAEFETILRSANAEDPDIVNWRFDGLDVAGVTPGQYEPDNKYWHSNRQELIALARFTTELRSERWEGKRARQPLEEWREQLQQRFRLRVHASVGAGWRDLLWAALELSNTDPKLVVDIKEKFGTLRAYHLADDWDLIADRLSGCICEVCGAPGTVRHQSWIVTRCDAHVHTSPWDDHK